MSDFIKDEKKSGAGAAVVAGVLTGTIVSAGMGGVIIAATVPVAVAASIGYSICKLTRWFKD